MTKSVFDFKAYKSYLLYETERKPAQRGLKYLLAKALGCQSAYLSQVLKGSAELSPEQGLRACEFFRLGQDEQDYLMLLLQKDRAGTQDLKTYFQKQINDLLKKRMNLVKRLGKESHLSETDKNTYYSSWIYSAIHLAVTINKLQSK